MGIIIRPWQKGDLEAIRKITWQSWLSTYSTFIPENDLRFYFDIHYTVEALLGMFDDAFTQGFVAQADDQVVGYARLVLNQDENRLYVSSLYLLPEFEGQGIGAGLLDAAGRCAAEKGLDRLWIGVMVKNRKALEFYRQGGFLFVREEPFTMGMTTVSHLIGYKKLGMAAVLQKKIYSTFNGGEGKESLPGLCFDLRSRQKEAWQELHEGYEILKTGKERDLNCTGFSVRLQYNPGRIKSSTGDVSEPGVKERGCFLCLDYLPEDQKGILYRDDYLVLCNPMPVFSSHFTVSHLDHRRQAIAEHIGTFLRIIADLGSGWMVLYNGAKCGASAPDHLHFQVVPSGQMPIEREICDETRLVLMVQIEGVIVYHAKGLGREVVILEGDNPIRVGNVFKGFLSALRKALLTDDEPMMNMAGFYKAQKWHLVIFPRRKHRPDAFFREGHARVVVSPGVIDMGGILVTPVEKDFDRLDGDAVESIYREVSLEGAIVKRVINAM